MNKMTRIGKRLLLMGLLVSPTLALGIDFIGGRKPDPNKIPLVRFLLHTEIWAGNKDIPCATCHHPSTDAADGRAPTTGAEVDFIDDGNPDPDKVRLGRLLFHDKILSGNENISCATCHHPLTDTGDGLSLPVGEGGEGLGVTRSTGAGADAIHERVPRNAPPIFMLGSTEVTRMFHDGRIEVDPSFPSGFKSPAGRLLPDNLENILAVQAMFPVTSATEMLGQGSENAISSAAEAAGEEAVVVVWDGLAQRLRANDQYVALFKAAFPDQITRSSDITYAHAANAIAAFEIAAWRADDSPYDRFRKGDSSAMSPQAERGMQLFFGAAGCAACHSGAIFSDMEHHAIAMPQIGPGKGNGIGRNEDWGRYPVTGNEDDKFKFRTPPLRNIALTAPYGHSGAYNTLEAVVRHHLDPVGALSAYSCEDQPVLPAGDDLDALDCAVMEDPILVQAIAAANVLNNEPLQLTDEQIAAIIAFLHALTDASNLDLRSDIPLSVPSGQTLVE